MVTSSTEDNPKLSILLTEGFKRIVYWNKYKVITEKKIKSKCLSRRLIDPSLQGINRLFVLAYLNDPTSTVNWKRK